MKPWIWIFLACLSASASPSGEAQRKPDAAKRAANFKSLSRFDRLSCALVRIEHENGYGTGFFVNKEGLILTAAHVVYQSLYSVQKERITTTLLPRENVQVRLNDGTTAPLAIHPESKSLHRAGFDLALISTDLRPSCSLNVGDANRLKLGQRLISMGYPVSQPIESSGTPTLALYEGFVSSRYHHPPIETGVQGAQLFPGYDLIRVQMPITPGASGSPIIDDADSVVGVISEVPIVWMDELDQLMQAATCSPGGSGVQISGFDVAKLLGYIIFVVKNFESSGAGLAVPISYLESKEPRRADLFFGKVFTFRGPLTAVTTITWIPEKDTTVEKMLLQVGTGPVGCAANPVLQLSGGTKTHIVTIDGGGMGSIDISESFKGGTPLTVGISVPATGCTNVPANVALVVQYTVQ